MGKDDFDACAMRMKDGMCFRFNKGLPCDAVKYVREQVGKWIFEPQCNLPKCSVCKTDMIPFLFWKNYVGPNVLFDRCPSCGARMEEE
jgi:hypothetical protein